MRFVAGIDVVFATVQLPLDHSEVATTTEELPTSNNAYCHAVAHPATESAAVVATGSLGVLVRYPEPIVHVVIHPVAIATLSARINAAA
ncbi:hypothetical protein KA405_05395 [Patescibacteria group bacterium]|nr:hypothetical protein [Patescibacteria group bacterium]